MGEKKSTVRGFKRVQTGSGISGIPQTPNRTSVMVLPNAQTQTLNCGSVRKGSGSHRVWNRTFPSLVWMQSNASCDTHVFMHFLVPAH